MPTLNDVLAGSQAQAVQVQQIIDALKGTPNKGVPVALVSLNDPSNYALTVQNDDPVNSRALSVLKADGTTLISADATGVTLGSPVNLSAGSVPGAGLANGSVTNAKLGPDVARANLLTNGGFEIWQRGAGPFMANSAFSADRWQIGIAGTDTLSVSRDPSNVDTSVGGTFAAACTFTKGSGTNTSLSNTVSDGNVLRGRTISASIRVRTATASAVSIAVGSDGTGGSAISVGSVHSGGGTWQTLTKANYAIPADATYFQVLVLFNASCTAYLDGACLVVGSQPADYAPLHPADDLARCLRYYEVLGGNGIAPIIRGIATANGQIAGWNIVYRARKAIVPTVTKNGTWTVSNCGQPAISAFDSDVCEIFATATAAGQFQAYTNAAGVNITIEANP